MHSTAANKFLWDVIYTTNADMIDRPSRITQTAHAYTHYYGIPGASITINHRIVLTLWCARVVIPTIRNATLANVHLMPRAAVAHCAARPLKGRFPRSAHKNLLESAHIIRPLSVKEQKTKSEYYKKNPFPINAVYVFSNCCDKDFLRKRWAIHITATYSSLLDHQEQLCCRFKRYNHNFN